MAVVRFAAVTTWLVPRGHGQPPSIAGRILIGVTPSPTPIDGVRRRDFSGPWDRVEAASVPVQLIKQMEVACS